MNYPLLEKLYYKNKQEYETEYLNRFNSISTIKFDIDINQNQGFVVITPQLFNKMFKINILNTNLNTLT